MVSEEVFEILAEIMDRCDNALCNLPSNHPKHERYFYLFKKLSEIISDIVGRSDPLWWKEYTSRDKRANYWKVSYDIVKIRKLLERLPEDVKDEIENRLREIAASDILLSLGKEGVEEVVRELISHTQEEVRPVGRNEVFWEYKVKRDAAGYKLLVYPREELGVDVYTSGPSLRLKYKNSEILWPFYELRDLLRSSIKKEDERKLKIDVSISPLKGRIIISLGFPENVIEVSKEVLKALTDIITIEMKKIDKIQEELKDIATPRES
ncbi:hypothetical protein A3L04_08655 [Thermococcus chitonophagus]|uniref:Uncharacterized protein n=2 Tax=Thermococcus chitonophagus TaxID=54262 RepID=A0A160VSE4_9EURY|nr:hypothetical protein A3L04_08655 [Thermococcus chitonophagus]CUX77740.1 hypothetical protein CHITON_0961 [Thermococcus chitonophagus]